MKKLSFLLLLIALLTGCHHLHDEVRGSGNIQRETRAVGSFTSIATEGSFEIEVVCQKPQSVEIQGDDNILALISTEVTNNVLHIKPARSYSVSEPIVLKIAVADLSGIAASGAGSIVVSGVKNDKFEIDANGAPSIRVSGDTKALNIDANGAGKVDTHKLHASRVEVESKGVARIEVYASEQLDVTVSGPSHVVYHGDAVLHQTIHGPGSVEKKVAEGS
jgi:Putative auto-transporter adhesin, head GIN domain